MEVSPSPQSLRESHRLARNGVNMSQISDATLSRAVPDLSDPRRYTAEGVEEVWSRLRKEHPLFLTRRSVGADFWSVLNHELAVKVLRDSAVFSSAGGMRLDADPVANEAAAGKMLIVTDPPRHGGIRRVINSGFTPRMVQRLTDNIRVTASAVIEDALEQGDVDFTQVAARLPVSVISDMLGVPRSDWDLMLELTMIAFGADETAGADPIRIAEAHTELLVYYDKLLQMRRREPQDDIVSALAHGVVDGAPLSDEEILLNCNGLISGGNETTRHATVGDCWPSSASRRSGPGCVRILASFHQPCRKSCVSPAPHCTCCARHGRTCPSEAGSSGQVTRWQCGCPRRTVTKRCSPTPIVSMSAALPIATWRSPRARISAWGRRWRPAN
ncbi:hypothetical protein GA0115255_109674 [Streptomyces sp. Ncost-T6T-2b]|nr:hypothetical protein GA0115255_109674 [Streptomyces sp. Ncost-T6T-2b]